MERLTSYSRLHPPASQSRCRHGDKAVTSLPNTNSKNQEFDGLMKWVERVRNAAFNCIQPITLNPSLIPDRVDCILVDRKEHEALRKLRDAAFSGFDIPKEGEE
jgi:hypothetical protein